MSIREHVQDLIDNLRDLTEAEYAELEHAMESEGKRRRTLAEAPARLDEITRQTYALEGITEGEQWVQPVTVGYPKDWPVTHNGQTWTSTVANNIWEPGVSAWHPEAGEGEDAPAWIQPTGAHDAYAKDAVVAHDGKTWTSDLDGNVWRPGEYGWTET